MWSKWKIEIHTTGWRLYNLATHIHYKMTNTQEPTMILLVSLHIFLTINHASHCYSLFLSLSLFPRNVFDNSSSSLSFSHSLKSSVRLVLCGRRDARASSTPCSYPILPFPFVDNCHRCWVWHCFAFPESTPCFLCFPFGCIPVWNHQQGQF